MNTVARSLLLAGALLMSSANAYSRPGHTRRPVPADEQRPAPAAPEIVPYSLTDFLHTLQRQRIYLLRAPPHTSAFGLSGPGTHVWFLLPSCRPPDPNDARDACPIDRLQVESVDGAPVHAGAMMTVLHGHTPRRVQGFVLDDSVRMMRVRLVTSQGSVRFEGIVDAGQFEHLPVADGQPTPSGFSLQFSRYPAR